MKHFSLSAILSLIVTVLSICSAFAIPIQQSCSISNVVSKIVPAVVNISTTQKAKKVSGNQLPSIFPGIPEDLFKFFQGFPEQQAPRKTYSLGSGFLVSSDGYIVTNHHVVEGADEINITLSSKKNLYKAKVIGKDPSTDIALLKIESKDKKQLPFLEFADSDKINVGDVVISVGNPFGLGGTVTSGIISAKGRHIKNTGYDDFLQTDAAINSGNSGGPLCDMEGKVVGVNSVILSPSGGNIGIGFASASNIVQPIIQKLKEKGVIERGWLGVTVQVVDSEMAGILNLNDPQGALVTKVAPNSPASKADIKPGDVILLYNGVEVGDTSHLVRLVGDTPLNGKAKILILRNGKKINVETTITKPQVNETSKNNHGNNIKEKTSTIEDDFLGITVADLDTEVRNSFDIEESETGVAVVEVKQESMAAFSELNVGDVIKSINQKEVKNIKDFAQLIQKAKKEKSKRVLLLIVRPGAGSIFMVISTNYAS